ncbi:MAG: DMT family transporter [Saprospiraceae bacterium]|nr:DMT family transporter [Saprospiraceae bacterium]MCB9324776.1 DMT family transporter [Lewinellaceae bacterium]
MSPQKIAYRDLHIAVFLFGFTAILGDLIQLSALTLVWWRVLITSISLLFLVKWAPLLKMRRDMLLKYAGIGVIVGLHWLAFYGSIKLANASIALVCMATTSFFTALLEPLILGRKVRFYEIVLGVFIVPGMILVANNVEFSMMAGIWVGLASALFASLFSILNKKLITHASEMNITLIEMSSAWVFLGIVLLVMTFNGAAPVQFIPSPSDWIYLLVLALLCTTFAYVLALRALHHLSAFASNLTINLEPVYGIILAWLILKDGEEVTPGFYLGGLIIIASVFSYPFLRKRFGG